MARFILLVMLATAASADNCFYGEVRMFAGNFAPKNWALCDGQLLAIMEHQALFSILGTTYGGDGRTTFALPDLRGRFPMHSGSGAGLTRRNLGGKGGSEGHNLQTNQLPSHTHTATVTAKLNKTTLQHRHNVSSQQAPAPTTTPGPNIHTHKHEVDGHNHTFDYEGVHTSGTYKMLTFTNVPTEKCIERINKAFSCSRCSGSQNGYRSLGDHVVFSDENCTLEEKEMPIVTPTTMKAHMNAPDSETSEADTPVYQPPDENTEEVETTEEASNMDGDVAVDATATIGNTGGSQVVNHMNPFLNLNYIICMSGDYPSRN
eukprot:m.38369 g.38369  ORF g.38369 m.38369 type:complete len:318 (+) comp9423_c0_seq3:160-1113(+)